jgi:hypothetical protein
MRFRAHAGRTRGDIPVFLRFAAVSAVTFLCAACAETTIEPPGAGAMHLISPAAAAELPPAKKTMSDKVLAAIALEAVTGRKPDPSRLTEPN